MTPIALSKVEVPNSNVLPLSDYPLHGLGFYDLETCSQYSGYVWSSWTTKMMQQVHVDPALQAMLDQSLQQEVPNPSQVIHTSTSASSSMTSGFRGSYATMFPSAHPYPDPIEDVKVNMESSADKRSRESPDSTLTLEGKSLKTSGVAKATPIEEAISVACTKVAATEEVVNDDAPGSPSARWTANKC